MTKKWQFYLITVFELVVLMLIYGCSSPTGPVNIRDRIPSTSQIQNPEQEPTVTDKVVPVSPETKTTTLPLVENLISKAYRALEDQWPNRAIEIAERGLRVDRKEARFYLILAQAYALQNNPRQSHYFAQQGLLYAEYGSDIHRELSTWVD